MLHVLISEKLYDPHMLPYIDGFGELEERVRPCTPEWAETETGIKADRIVRLARELAEAAPRVLWYPGWFTARYADSFVTVRSAYLINALLGSIGARGGMPISLSPKETGKRLRPLSALYPNTVSYTHLLCGTVGACRASRRDDRGRAEKGIEKAGLTGYREPAQAASLFHQVSTADYRTDSGRHENRRVRHSRGRLFSDASYA